MPTEPSAEDIADGFALWDEHRPQSAEDWLAIASRFNAAQDDRAKASPLFAALSLAVEQRDTNEMRATMAEEVAASIDTPAIHAAGVAEGRAAMRDEIVEWLRGLFAEDALPDAIEAAFPTTGEKTDG